MGGMGGMPGMGRRPSGPVKAKAIEHRLNLTLEVGLGAGAGGGDRRDGYGGFRGFRRAKGGWGGGAEPGHGEGRGPRGEETGCTAGARDTGVLGAEAVKAVTWGRGSAGLWTAKQLPQGRWLVPRGGAGYGGGLHRAQFADHLNPFTNPEREVGGGGAPGFCGVVQRQMHCTLTPYRCCAPPPPGAIRGDNKEDEDQQKGAGGAGARGRVSSPCAEAWTPYGT